MATHQEILDRLPHKEPRPGQVQAIERILAAFAAGKKYVILEAPTGAGKSAIGLTVADFFPTSYYLTIQKILQQQLARDYARGDNAVGLVDLMGRNAYPCTFYETFGQELVEQGKITNHRLTDLLAKDMRCDDGYCQRQLGKSRCRSCFAPRSSNPEYQADANEEFKNRHSVEFSTCPYYERVFEAIQAPKVLMNFSAFLCQTGYTTHFAPRDLMIVDEGHHCEGQLMDFVTLTLSDRDLPSMRLPIYDEAARYAVWIEDNNVVALITEKMDDAKAAGNQKKADEWSDMLGKIERFMKCVVTGAEWVCEHKVHEQVGGGGASFNTVMLKPVYVHEFSDMLFKYSEHVLIMSATILDVRILTKSLGIKEGEYEFVRMNNAFPLKSRPIYVKPLYKASGGQANANAWMPALIQAVDEHVAMYEGHRGIIHTHNFSITKAIMENCKTKKRFLCQTDFESKEEMLIKHSKTQGSVIVAPAMHEGLDLKGDLGRFQLVVKTPYPNFYADKQLLARSEADFRYIVWLTALKLVQCVGRCVRDETDWADTYIFDSTVTKLLSDADKMLPKWFKEAIKKVKVK
jgi:ATP-dependent DNA helicase DinG